MSITTASIELAASLSYSGRCTSMCLPGRLFTESGGEGTWAGLQLPAATVVTCHAGNRLGGALSLSHHLLRDCPLLRLE